MTPGLYALSVLPDLHISEILAFKRLMSYSCYVELHLYLQDQQLLHLFLERLLSPSDFFLQVLVLLIRVIFIHLWYRNLR